MSYNGGGGRSSDRPLSGGKGDVREGGIRVPFIVRGPGVEPNSWSHQAVVGYNLYNTFSDLAGIEEPAPANTESGSFIHLLKGEEHPIKRSREELVFHFPHYQGDTPYSAIMLGNYKLLHFYEAKTNELYDLSKDLK
ncbi:MAG: sulfatase/phosphatase domain-containing protein, partial [Verrucomicrobiota bacterium]|nr:sulfatase/phosphatase domain-containing protein [Verrucomicrobiota bacterium]